MMDNINNYNPFMNDYYKKLIELQGQTPAGQVEQMTKQPKQKRVGEVKKRPAFKRKG